MSSDLLCAITLDLKATQLAYHISLLVPEAKQGLSVVGIILPDLHRRRSCRSPALLKTQANHTSWVAASRSHFMVMVAMNIAISTSELHVIPVLAALEVHLSELHELQWLDHQSVVVVQSFQRLLRLRAAVDVHR